MYLRLVLIVISIVLLTISSLIPFFVVKGGSCKWWKWRLPILSLLNCFACGIFMSTCLLGLFPHLEMSERAIKTSVNGTLSGDSLLMNSKFVILMGFILIVLIEQLIVTCLPNQHITSSERSTTKSRLSNIEPGVAFSRDEEPLVQLNSNDSESEDETFGRIEFLATEKSTEEQRSCGHSHAAALNGSACHSFLLLFALFVHTIFEGVALGAQQNDSDFMKLLLSIMMHEVLCSFAFGVSLSKEGITTKMAIISIVILSSSLPFGILLMELLSLTNNFFHLILKFILEGVAAGIFIYVATVEMLAPELSHNHSKYGLLKGLALCFGSLTFIMLNSLIS